MCDQIVEDIKRFQDDYLPSEVDGYFINRMGHELVHLKRKNSDAKGITGFIEYNDLRRHSMDWYDYQKIKAVNFAIEEASKRPHVSCSIM
jgi:hypothetical protein